MFLDGGRKQEHLEGNQANPGITYKLTERPQLGLLSVRPQC